MNYMNDITSIFTLQVSITWQWIEGYQNMTYRRSVLSRQSRGPMVETLDYTIRIGSTLIILYFDLYQNMTVDSTLWSSGQPQGVDKCAEWNTVLQGLKVVPCSAKRGYVCEKNMF